MTEKINHAIVNALESFQTEALVAAFQPRFDIEKVVEFPLTGTYDIIPLVVTSLNVENCHPSRRNSMAAARNYRFFSDPHTNTIMFFRRLPGSPMVDVSVAVAVHQVYRAATERFMKRNQNNVFWDCFTNECIVLPDATGQLVVKSDEDIMRVASRLVDGRADFNRLDGTKIL